MQPWRTLEELDTPEGTLALRQRGERDFLLTIDGRVLMSSMLHRSEDALSRLAIERIEDRPRPRVLTAGLGLGFTLRALLDVVGRGAQVDVGELHEPIVRWCRGPLASVNGNAASDPRVRVILGDVMDRVREAAHDASRRYDAIVVDLMEGPSRGRARVNGHLYGSKALASVRAALSPGGVYAVWGEEPDPSFVELLQRSGFDARKVVVGSGPKHVVYVAQPAVARGRSNDVVPRGGELPHGKPSSLPSEGADIRRRQRR
ncbi:MAG: spermidine synthase [Deltaproteobacteria bacterium]|nr:spermidine synthase [Deltaproteobacteria bacterium]